MKRAFLILQVITLAITANSAAHSAAAKVFLRQESEVQPAETVTIDDVARIEAPQALAEKIGRVTVATGPLPGQHRSIGANYINVKLKAAQLENIKVVGPEKIDVFGACIKISSDELAARAKEFLLEQLPSNSMTYDITIDRAPKEIIIARGDNLEIRPRLLGSGLQPGVGTVALDVVLDGKTATTANAAFTLKAVADVMVATNVIRQSEAITPSNVSWEPRDVTRVKGAIIRIDDQDTQDWIARRTIQAGAVITAASVEHPPVVRRGDSVNLIVKCGNVTLHTTAEVKQDGRAGETIRVLSSVSNGEVRARVVEPGLVEIER
jgi:flagella basal body P-ring formation protein FlgA